MIFSKTLQVGALPSGLKSIKYDFEADISNIKGGFHPDKAKTKLTDHLFNRFSSKGKMNFRGIGFTIQSVTIG